MLGLVPFDTRWFRPSRVEDNPLAWLVEDTSGFIHDARHLPRPLQEELHAAGLIPFVPPAPT
jgi:hypothetical protein